MSSSSTKAQSKQLLGVQAALRSKKPLDTADIVRDVRDALRVQWVEFETSPLLVQVEEVVAEPSLCDQLSAQIRRMWGQMYNYRNSWLTEG
jgi:hypothetical protein